MAAGFLCLNDIIIIIIIIIITVIVLLFITLQTPPLSRERTFALEQTGNG